MEDKGDDHFFWREQREQQPHLYSSRQERLNTFPPFKRSNSAAQRKKIRKLLIADILLLLVALVVGMSILRKNDNAKLIDWDIELYALNSQDNCKVVLRLLPKLESGAKKTLQWRVELKGEMQQRQIQVDREETREWELNFPYQESAQVLRSWLKMGEQELQLHAFVE